MSHAAPIVYVVDDDVSVRESLELMIVSAGWEPAFASAQDFLSPPALFGRAACSRRQSSGSQRTRSANARCRRPGGHADHLHHGLRRCADFGSRHESGRSRIPDQTIQRRFAAECPAEAIQNSLAALERETELRRLRERYESLSSREREVMALVVSGLMNKQAGGNSASARSRSRPTAATSCARWMLDRSLIWSHERETAFDARIAGLTLRPFPQRRGLF